MNLSIRFLINSTKKILLSSSRKEKVAEIIKESVPIIIEKVDGVYLTNKKHIMPSDAVKMPIFWNTGLNEKEYLIFANK